MVILSRETLMTSAFAPEMKASDWSMNTSFSTTVETWNEFVGEDLETFQCTFQKLNKRGQQKTGHATSSSSSLCGIYMGVSSHRSQEDQKGQI